MAKAIVVYGSSSGETEWVSEIIADVLRENGIEVTLKDVTELGEPEDILNYDLILIGSSTWGLGELQRDMKVFEPELRKLNLAGKFAAAFGPGDRIGYPDHFCRAVDIIEDDLIRCGAEIIMPPLKVDESEEREEREKKIRKWAEELAETLKEEMELE